MVYHTGGPLSSGKQGTWWQARFYPLLVFLEEEKRVMPDTVAHDEIARHRPGCDCGPCLSYPQALKTQLKKNFSRGESIRRRAEEERER
jgi:hypothetical protein